MKILFMGTPDFAIPCLTCLLSKHEVVAVVTPPDKPKGRGQKMLPPPVKSFAMEQGIDVLQPISLKNDILLKELEAYQPEVIIVVAYGKILPNYILAYPKFGCINLHASLLPKYRGAAPIQWAIINGERETGVCTMKMEAGLDTGDVYEVAKIEIKPNETAGELHDRLCVLGAQLMVSTLDQLPDLKATPQDHTKSTYAPMITKETAKIEWNQTANKIVSLIHGMNPAPKAHTTYQDEPLKIVRASVGEGKGRPGQILGYVKDKGLMVGCHNGTVYLREIQPSGGKVMGIEDYLRGHKLEGFFV